MTLSAAKQFAEKEGFWVAQRFNAAIKPFSSVQALAAEVLESCFSATVKPMGILPHLRRGLKPRRFKTKLDSRTLDHGTLD